MVHSKPAVNPRRLILLLLPLLLIALLAWGGFTLGISTAQTPQQPLWTTSSRDSNSRTQQLNRAEFDRLLATTGVITLPLPSGEMVVLSTTQSSIFEPGFVANYPVYTSYVLDSAENPALRGRLVTLHSGIHALIEDNEQVVLIDPVGGSRTAHRSRVYWPERELGGNSAEAFAEELVGEVDQFTPPSEHTTSLSDGLLRTYRLAVAADGDFTQAQGGITATLDTIVSRVSDVDHIFQTQVGIGFQLVADSDQIVFTDPATDPYTDTLSKGETAAANIAVLDTYIGSSNYDIGHLFTARYSGGVARFFSACTSVKGHGLTKDGLLWVFAHELGHMFGAQHEFTGASSFCTNGSWGATEPGAGNSIMSYAELCAADNSGERVLEFSSNSLKTMRSFIEDSGGSCAVTTPQSNLAPVADAGSSFWYVPASTPFQLYGTASDPDNGTLRYRWEQIDYGRSSHVNNPLGNSPLFRLFRFTDTPLRSFPQLGDLIDGRQRSGELLPNESRDSMRFRFVVSDEADVAATQEDSIYVSVAGQLGPLRVLSPQRADVWQAEQLATVRWDVAGTNLSPIRCESVNLDLSLDGGWTYTVSLAAGVPNNGTHALIVPTVSSHTARVRVACAKLPDHFFFAISNGDFVIESSIGIGIALAANPQFVAMCGGDSAEIDLNIHSYGGFAGATPVAVTTGLADLTASLSPSITLNSSSNATPATLPVTITVGTTVTAQTVITVALGNGSPTAPSLIAPAANAAWVATTPLLQWQSEAGASSYDVQISRDPLFGINTTTLHRVPAASYQLPQARALNTDTTYYWRVRTRHNCNGTATVSSWSSRGSFHTARQELPIQSDLLLWLDANDVDANEAPDGPLRYTQLPIWQDKSGHGRNAVSDNAPYLGEQAYDGHGRVELKNRSYLLTDTVAALNAATETTLFAVFALHESAETGSFDYRLPDTSPVTTTGFLPLLDMQHSDPSSRFALGIARTGSQRTVGVMTQTVGTTAGLSAAVPSGHDWLLLGYEADSAQSDLHLFGDAVAGLSNGLLFDGGDAVTQAVLGGLPAHVGELLIFDRKLTVAERQAVEGYLAHKWGLNEQLVAGHPFGGAPYDQPSVVPVVNSAEFTITEYSPVNTLVGTVSASSPDTLTYSIANGNTDDLFQIDPSSGELRIAALATLSDLSQSVYHLTIDVTNQPADPLAARTGSGVITIYVSDINLPPTAATTPIVMPADVPVGAPIGRISASDLDVADTLAFAVVGGNTAGAFAIDPNSGTLQVVDNSGFADPLEQFYTLTVTVADSGAPVQTVTVTQLITVSNCLADDLVVTSAEFGPCSLRDMLDKAPPATTIRFADALQGSTLTLTQPITLSQAVTIDGGDNAIQFSGDSDGDGSGETRLFTIDSATPVTLRAITLTHGSSSGFGGAIHKTGSGDLTLQNCAILHSSAASGGGGLYATSGAVLVQRCTLAHNSSMGSGGAIHQCGGLLELVQSSLLFNTSAADGGGLYQACGTVSTLTNNTVYSNTATTDGGGVFVTNSPITLSFGTLSHNAAQTGGGLRAASGGQVWMHGTVLANSVSGADCAAVSALLRNTDNWIADGSCSGIEARQPSGDPLLGPLQNNGGRTLTLAPLVTSPLLNQTAADCPAIDQRGFTRLDALCDIGAVELGALPTGVAVRTVSRVSTAGSLSPLLLLFVSLLCGFTWLGRRSRICVARSR